LKRAIKSAMALLKKADAGWVEKSKRKADDKTTEKGRTARNKAREQVFQAIAILEEALKLNSGDGQNDKNP
jgi:hypothetical protein